MKMDGKATADGWAFADRSKTTAEVIRNLYEDFIRDGCRQRYNYFRLQYYWTPFCGTFFEMQRIGDDTSGND